MEKALKIMNGMTSRKIEMANVNDLNEARNNLLGVNQELRDSQEIYDRLVSAHRNQSNSIQQEIANFVKEKESFLAKMDASLNARKNEVKQRVSDVKSVLSTTERVVVEVEQAAKELGVPMPIPVKEAKQLINSVDSYVRNVTSRIG